MSPSQCIGAMCSASCLASAKVRACAKELFGEKLAAQPALALVNPVLPGESRVLMAPLPIVEGGWGQRKGYTSRHDPKFTKMADLVAACIIRRQNENVRGWIPTLKMGGGDDWFVESRRKFQTDLEKKGE